MRTDLRVGVSLGSQVRVFVCAATFAVGGCRFDSSGGSGALLRWDGDVLWAGESPEITEAVPGDVILAGGNVRFSGTAEGSYLGAGGEQEIGGRIANSLRAAGGRVRVRSDVGRNISVAGGEVRIREDALVGRNAYLAGGEIEVTGTIEGSVLAAGGEVVLDGPVGGNVRVEAGRLRVGPRARIEGDLEYRIREGPADIDPAAQVGGDVIALAEEPIEGRGGGRAIFLALRTLAFLLVGSVVVALLPDPTFVASGSVRLRPLASIGAGLLWLVLVPLAIIVAAVTLIGIPLALIVALLFGISLYLAPIPPAMWLGNRLLPRMPRGKRTVRTVEFLAGGLVIVTLTFVPVLGIIVRCVAVLLGLGAVALTVYGARRTGEIV